MASDLYMNFLWAFEEIGKDLNKGDEYFEKIYSYIPKDELDEYKQQFLAEDLDEAIDPSKALEVKKNSDADVIFYGYQYKNEKPVEFDPPRELSSDEYKAEIQTIVDSKTSLNADEPTGNRYGHDRDFIFYALYNRKNEKDDNKMNESINDADTIEAMRKAIDAAYSTTDIAMEVEEILRNNNANEDDSDPELGYFKGMSDEDIENAYSEVKALIVAKYTKRDIPNYILKAFSFDYIEDDLDESLNEDMSIRAKLKALYPELDFGDEVVEGFDDDMEFDIDESHETRMMDLLYEGSDDFDDHDDEDTDEFSDCEDDECWENDLISDDYDDET